MIDLDALAPADRQLWDAMGAATPLWSVMPTPGACHELGACRATAQMLGTPLLPWQEWYARLATERRLDDPRRYRYPMFLLTVPRQAGKTTIVRVVLLTRMILYSDRRAFYTAQTGKDATERWADLAAAVMARRCPLAPLVSLRKAAGSARLTLEPTGSRLSPFAPTPGAMHGYTPHDVAIDELFAFSEAEGTDLEGAIVPAQMTLVDRQLLGLSTAGDRTSTYLKRKVAEGRAACRDGDPSMGYAEWSLPSGLDPYDPASWTFHPAFGLTQQLIDFEQAAKDLPPGEWLRAMMNVWTEDGDPLFDMAAYDDSRVDGLVAVELGAVVVGFAVSADRDRAALVAAWAVEVDGSPRIAVKLLRADDDPVAVEQLAAELVRAPQERRPKLYGPGTSQQTRSSLDELRRSIAPYAVTSSRPLDQRIVELDAREWSIASAQLHAAIIERRLAWEHDDGSVDLRTGVDRAIARPGVDESWQLSHTSPPEVLALAAAVRAVRIKVDTPRVVVRHG